MEDCASADIGYLRERGRARVLEAVEMMPLEEKQAYKEAVSRAPDICAMETDPLIFLRRCDYDEKAAACRLCLYWKERVSIFQERAFLPMTITGDGALTREDTLSLRSGWPAILPPTKTGKQVVFADRRLVHPEASSFQSRLRAFFYLSRVLQEFEDTQTDGFLVIVLVTMPRLKETQEQLEYGKHYAFLMSDVFPTRKKVIYVNMPTSPRQRYAVQDILEQRVNACVASTGTLILDLEVLFEREKGDLITELEALGMTRDGLPTSIGGNWSMRNPAKWCRDQAQRERVLYKDALKSARLFLKSLPNSKVKKDRRTMQRELNLIHSRKKRELKEQELERLKAASSQLASEKELLLEENRRLEQFVRDAEQYIESN